MLNEYIDKLSKKITMLLIYYLFGKNGVDSSWYKMDVDVRQKVFQDINNIISNNIKTEINFWLRGL